MTEDLRFPIGKFSFDGNVTEAQRASFMEEIAQTPGWLRESVEGLSPEQIAMPYRPGGWTVGQVVHHLPDSHLNGYTRFRLALTEDEPAIKPYHEDLWAELEDGRNAPLDVSIQMLGGLHDRFVLLLKSLSPQDFARQYRHPDQGLVPLDRLVAAHAWHGKHHIAQITSLRKRMGWV